MNGYRGLEKEWPYRRWKIGEEHGMFVRFIHGGRKELAGLSDIVRLRLSDGSGGMGEME